MIEWGLLSLLYQTHQLHIWIVDSCKQVFQPIKLATYLVGKELDLYRTQ
jgi:hypothetical protein